ncbi:YihY/virulence factor BrkB family protein [Scatolibacter rhodanostii]|uniref:YihY/virulence factor BrkB family protein n=1 Tax=Scatolibacter rhodanostii TaxID=2014781 RepID=UPI0013565FAE|nr:YihY/virulence factor BrkB family protein [Scatolibacter rhodanostii]
MDILKKHLYWFGDRLEKDQLDSLAAHSAYFIIISFLPFFTFLLTLFQQIHFSGTTLINEMLQIFPESVAQYIQGILAESTPVSSILSVSIITFLWSASSGMVAVIKGLDTIYSVEKRRSFLKLRLLSILYLVAFALVLLITAVTLVFGSTLYQHILDKAPPFIAIILINFKSLFGFVLLVVFFSAMFNTFPRKSASFINNLFGAIFSAAGWVLFSFFFSIFVNNFSNFSVVYGSLATLVVLMFWLHTCMYILFLGAEVSVWLEKNTVFADIKSLFSRRKKAKKTITLQTQSSPTDNCKEKAEASDYK